MSAYNLRFRRRKLIAVLGLALGILSMPLFQATNAATGVALDVNQASRIATGTGASQTYSDSVSVQDRNVVEISTVIHNAEDPDSGKIAEGMKLQVIVPKGPGTTIKTQGTVKADNLAPRAPYTTTDTTTMTSANGKAFTLGNIRSFYLQRNQNPDPRDPKFNWDGGTKIPTGQVDIAENANGYLVTVQPTADGKLKPCFSEAVKVTFLVDVTQPGTIDLNKQVRKAGETTWSDSNSASVGDTLEYQIKFTNPGPGTVNNVVIRDQLPAHVQYVAGSAKLKNTNFPNGTPISDAVVTNGVNVGNYAANSTGYVFLQAKVTSLPGADASKQCFIRNVAYVKADNVPEKNDWVQTNFACKTITTPTPTPTPTTTPTSTPTPSETPCIPKMTPTPNPESTPSMTPTPSCTIVPSTPPTPPNNGELPKTGAMQAAALSLFAIAASAYLYLRERRALAKATHGYRVK